MKTIKFYLVLLFTACTLLVNAQTPEGYPANYARGPRFKALVYYTQHAEEAHYQFSLQAVEFFKKLNYGDGFRSRSHNGFVFLYLRKAKRV